MPHIFFSFARQRNGNVLLTLGLALPVLVGFLGMGVETGVWYVERRQVQTQADAGALAGAYSLAGGYPSEIVSSAYAAVTDNGSTSRPTPIVTVNHPPLSGSYAGDSKAVE